MEGRTDIFQKIESSVKPSDFNIWVHCASLGEFEQGRPLIEKIKREHPDAKIILTFFSPSGYEIRKNYGFADAVFYIPIDSRKNARRFLELVRPRLVIFVKYEFWYYYFMAISRRKIPFLMISAVFRRSQTFFQWYGSLFRKMLSGVSHFFVQDGSSQRLLRELDLGNSTICGDTRIDRVLEISANIQPIQKIEDFLQGGKSIIGGSVYMAECRHLQQALSEGLIKDKLILVPHDVSDGHIREIQNLFGIDTVLYTEYSEKDRNKQVMIVNTVGILSSIYQYGQIAIIGGGFGKSIHNILEPAAFGLAIVFGPNYHKFKEAHEMLASNAVFSYHDYPKFAKLLEHFSSEKELALAGNASRTYLQMNAGGTEKIYKWVVEKGYLNI